jgi:DNA polymerase alpha-associated DNA helicase A
MVSSENTWTTFTYIIIVSMTRPKRQLCVVGDSATLSKGSSFLKRWMAHLEEHSDLRYPNISDLELDSA